MIDYKRLFHTGLIVLMYCLLWELLELLVYGQIIEDIVDNIIVSLFAPFIYKALENKEREENT